MNKPIVIITLAFVLVSLVIGHSVWSTSGQAALISGSSQTASLDIFAQCLKDKGVTFFGAFWCPHCQAQKRLFGSAAEKLPYKECSTSDGSAQTQECKDKKIDEYPTWEFADGSRLGGEQSLESLAAKSSCSL